jgi:hypothetical protein
MTRLYSLFKQVYVSLLRISFSLIVLDADMNNNMTKPEIAITYHVTVTSLHRLLFCEEKLKVARTSPAGGTTSNPDGLTRVL